MEGIRWEGKQDLTRAMTTIETRAAVPAIKTKEAEVRDRATRIACVSARLFAGEAGERGYFKAPH